jgi:competence protein ComEA
LEQSTPAWRVFDEPANGVAGGSAATGSAGSGGPVGASAAPRPVALASPNVLLAAAALIGALLIGGVAFVLAMNGSGAGAIDGPPASADAASGVAALDSGAPVFGDLVVDVSGAVAQPGLYHLPKGSRVGDAVDAAGGFAPRVDAARVGQELNLAAALTDGEQIKVPSRDEAPGAGGGTGNGTGGGAGGAAASGGGATGALVNLNTATQAELEALPGIGPVTATKIIAAREEKPFGSVDEIRERGLVGEKTFGQLKALVTVG